VYKFVLPIGLAAVSLAIAASVDAATNSFNGGTANYNAAANWSLGHIPAAGDQADISNGLSATLNGIVAGQPDGLWVGNAGTAGSFDVQTGGSLTLNGAFVVGNAGSNATPLSTLTISGGTLNQSGVGQSMIGGDAGAPGKLVVSGGTLHINTTNTASGDNNPVLGVGGIFAAGAGSVQQTGGSIDIQTSSATTRLNGFGLGTLAGSQGAYTMSGGTLTVGAFSDNGVDGDTEMNMFVGYKGQGTFTQTGGTVNVSRKLTIGMAAGVSSLYDMSSGNGVLNTTTYGEMIVSNGGADTLLVGGNSTVNTYGFRMGRGAGNGTITMTGGTVNVTGATGIYTSGTGTLNLGGGLLDMHGNNIKSLTNFNFTGGELRNANVDISMTQAGGTLAPGAAATPGTTTIGATTGVNYTQTAGTLAFDILDTGVPGLATTYDHVTVGGAATLDGTVAVSLLSGYTPTAGDSFDLLDWGTTLSGTPTWSLPTLGDGLSWDTSAFATSGMISIMQVPEPGSLSLLALGLVGLAVYAWRKRG
jgi:hypothetical protein